MHKILRTPGTIVISGLLLILIATGVANAAALINSGDVKNNSLKSEDIKDGTLKSADVKKNSLNAGDLAAASVGSSELTDGSVSSGDIKNGTVASGDLADGSVTAGKLAPGAVAFPNSLWGPVLRNQTGAAQSQVQVGPAGQPLGDGSLRLFVTGNPDIAAFGNSIDFAGFELADITNLSFWTYSPDATPAVRPRLAIEINPHLLADDTLGGATEFTTLIYQPASGTTGWQEHAGILDDPDWYLTGQEGTDMGCTEDTKCTFTAIRSALVASVDGDPAAPAISTGVYFGLGSGVSTPTETAVDAFVFNGFEFDFEPMGVFMKPATP